VLKCFNGITTDGQVNKPEFLKWAASGDDNFKNLREHLRGVDEKATKALLNLYSKVAVSLAQTKAQKSVSPAKVHILHISTPHIYPPHFILYLTSYTFANATNYQPTNQPTNQPCIDFLFIVRKRISRPPQNPPAGKPRLRINNQLFIC
jgi:hypothetical protein